MTTKLAPTLQRTQRRRGTIALFALLALVGCAQLPFRPVPDAGPAQAHAVVFDIDGTLTPAVMAIFEARPDAARAVHAYADKGYAIIYLSTRTGWLSAEVPDWLQRHGFPQGSVHIAQTAQERDHPDDYKAALLREFRARGWVVDYAYGDSSTDLTAYAAAGVPADHVFALRRRGQAACQAGASAACLDGWTAHLAYIESTVPRVDAPHAPGHAAQ